MPLLGSSRYDSRYQCRSAACIPLTMLALAYQTENNWVTWGMKRLEQHSAHVESGFLLARTSAY